MIHLGAFARRLAPAAEWRGFNLGGQLGQRTPSLAATLAAAAAPRLGRF